MLSVLTATELNKVISLFTVYKKWIKPLPEFPLNLAESVLISLSSANQILGINNMMVMYEKSQHKKTK